MQPNLALIFLLSHLHVYHNVGDLGLANSALVVLHSRVKLSIVLQHFCQGVEPLTVTIRTHVVPAVGDVEEGVAVHALGLPGPKGAASLAAVEPTI